MVMFGVNRPPRTSPCRVSIRKGTRLTSGASRLYIMLLKRITPIKLWR